MDQNVLDELKDKWEEVENISATSTQPECSMKTEKGMWLADADKAKLYVLMLHNSHQRLHFQTIKKKKRKRGNHPKEKSHTQHFMQQL